MTNKQILEKANIHVTIGDVPSRKEQRENAKAELEGFNPANLFDLYRTLKSFGFAVGFGSKLYKDAKGDYITKYNHTHFYVKDDNEAEERLVFGMVKEGEAAIYTKGEEAKIREVVKGEEAYTHANIFFSYVQNAAISYKIASMILEAEGAKKGSDIYKNWIEKRSKLYEAIKDFCEEANIERKCTANDAEAVSTYAARFTYCTENIKDGIKYAPAGVATFANNFMKFLAAGDEGLAKSETCISNRLARYNK